jgi:hypothetical protein
MAGKKKNMKGKGIMDFLKNVNSKLKEGKYISRGLDWASKSNIPLLSAYSAPLSQASSLASSLGYGKKRKMKK